MTTLHKIVRGKGPSDMKIAFSYFEGGPIDFTIEGVGKLSMIVTTMHKHGNEAPIASMDLREQGIGRFDHLLICSVAGRSRKGDNPFHLAYVEYDTRSRTGTCRLYRVSEMHDETNNDHYIPDLWARQMGLPQAPRY